MATPLYPPEIGGPATYTTLMERELPARGFEIKVVAYSESRKWPKGLSHLHYCFRLLWSARGCKVIFAQDPISVGLPSLIAAKLLRKKFIVRMVGDYAWEQSAQRYGITDTIDDFQNKKYGWQVEWLRFWQQFVAKRVDIIITPSEYFNKIVQGWGVDSHKVKTVYNGIKIVTPSTLSTRSLQKTILTAGRLVPWKGMSKLLEALSELPDWHLEIIGDGPDRSSLEEKVEQLGLRNRVEFKGVLKRDELLEALQNAWVFVLNTRFESFSFQTVEAMVYRKPIITTNIGSLPELIDNGREGILLNPDDVPGMVRAIKSVEQEPDLWHERVASAGRKAQKFSIENTVSETTMVIKELIA